jgi:hypothetical protein
MPAAIEARPQTRSRIASPKFHPSGGGGFVPLDVLDRGHHRFLMAWPAFAKKGASRKLRNRRRLGDGAKSGSSADDPSANFLNLPPALL